MGKRKKAAKKPTGAKKNEPLATVFPCLFCNHEKSVAVKLNKKEGVGQLSCKVCSQEYQCQINYLSAAVDVYSDWVDACDSVAKGNANGEGVLRGSAPARASAPGRPSVSKPRDEADDDDDDDIIDDEDGMGGYGGRDEGIVPDDEDDY